MSEITAKQRRKIHPSETLILAVSFKSILKTSETVSSATVAVSPTGPTLGSASVNGSTLTIVDESATAGQAITFSMSGATVDTTYTITCTATLSTGQIRVRKIVCDCVSS